VFKQCVKRTSRSGRRVDIDDPRRREADGEDSGAAMSVDAATMVRYARELLHPSTAAQGSRSTAGLWPRASALLARQALEATLAELWRLRAPGLEHCPMRAQLLCVDGCLPNSGDLAARARYAWSGLSRACHHHPYELPPTISELAGWMGTVEELTAVVTCTDR
jgi:hypothetical protein